MTKNKEYPPEEKVRFLKGVSLFENTPEPVLKKIARHMNYVKIKKQAAVFQKGDKLRALYIVITGALQVHDGDYIFSTFGANDYFGEYSLIDEETRSATVTALSEVELFELDYKTFNSWMDKEPILVKSMLKGFVRRLRENNILEERLTKRTLLIQRQKNDIVQERDELEKQKRELVSLNNTKDKFFSIIGHDLKNPFSTVIGLSELLINDFGHIERDRLLMFIEQIYKFSSNAYTLLENLLQWARSQTGKLKVNKNLYNLRDIVEENVELLSGNAKQKNIDISFPKESLYMYFDMNMISTVVRNLVSNAIKFKPTNGRISVDYQDKGNKVLVSVHDTGVGISKKDQDKLFKIDSNPTTIGTSDEKGSGLGLILAKEFIDRHQGEIWVESQPGEGSIFKFTIHKAENPTP